MIARLRGTLIESTFTEALIECAGVGYSVNIPLCTYDKLPQPGNEAVLHTVLVVREDDMSLYGFATPRELKIFSLLCTVKDQWSRAEIRGAHGRGTARQNPGY